MLDLQLITVLTIASARSLRLSVKHYDKSHDLVYIKEEGINFWFSLNTWISYSMLSTSSKILAIRSTSCISATICNGSSNLNLSYTPSGLRTHDNIWMSSIFPEVLPYQLRAGGAYEYNYGSNHIIEYNDIALQRPALNISLTL